MAICKGCGAEMIWVGRIPCDPAPVKYWEKPKAKGKIVTPEGKIVSCEFSGEGEETGTGYITHWATCPKALSFKKKG